VGEVANKGGLDQASKCSSCGRRVGADSDRLWWCTHRTPQGDVQLFCGECEPDNDGE
jgi:hypothetical protein